MQYPEFMETLPEEPQPPNQMNDFVTQQENQHAQMMQNQQVPQPAPQQDIIDEPYVPEQDQDNVSVSSYAGSELSPEQERQKKKDLLIILTRLQKKGYTLSRHFTMESDLIEMQAEVESIRKEANLGMVVKGLKRALCVGTFFIEQANNKYKPLGGAHLDGWSNQVNNDVTEGTYDEILEELYEKYCNRLSMPPELKLLTMLGTSAIQYHIAQSIIQRTLNVAKTDEILRKNPGLQQQILRAAAKETQQVQETMENPSDFHDILEELQAEEDNEDIEETYSD